MALPFLWSREARRGETEGRKPRPVALTLLTRNAAGELEVLMAPITSQPPGDNPFVMEVPDIEKRRAGLHPRLDLWVVTDEATPTTSSAASTSNPMRAWEPSVSSSPKPSRG